MNEIFGQPSIGMKFQSITADFNDIFFKVLFENLIKKFFKEK